MSSEYWAIIGVGAALAGLQWHLYRRLKSDTATSLDRITAELSAIRQRLARMDG